MVLESPPGGDVADYQDAVLVVAVLEISEQPADSLNRLCPALALSRSRQSCKIAASVSANAMLDTSMALLSRRPAPWSGDTSRIGEGAIDEFGPDHHRRWSIQRYRQEAAILA